MNWELIIVVLPSVVAAIFAVVAFILKRKKDSMQGMSKEISEFLLTIIDAAKDKYFSQEEMLKIIKEGKDVIEEAEKLLEQ